MRRFGAHCTAPIRWRGASTRGGRAAARTTGVKLRGSCDGDGHTPAAVMKHSRTRVRQPRLHVVPITLRAAKAYVSGHHRHLRAPTGAKLAIGIADGASRLRGVAVLGRPVARRLDTGAVLEVTRVATDGCANACSALYGAARRIARVLGYQTLVTYTLAPDS